MVSRVKSSVASSAILDGLIVVGKDWRVSLSKENLKVIRKDKLKLVEVRRQDFKGVRLGGFSGDYKEQADKVFKIHIGTQGDYSVYILVLMNQRSNQNKNWKVSRLLDEVAEKTFFGDDSSIKLWKHREISFVKLRKFGNRILTEVKAKKGVSKVVLLHSQLGQAVDFKTLKCELTRFDNNHVEEIVVHFAMDFRKEETALFFDTQSVYEKYNKKNISQKFAVCLLKSVGNFYVNIDQFAKHHELLKFCEAKFYSEPFKHFHTTCRELGRGTMYKEMMNPLPRKCSENQSGNVLKYRHMKDLEDYLQTLTTVEHEIAAFGTTTTSFAARCEVILRLTNQPRNCRSGSKNLTKQAHKTILDAIDGDRGRLKPEDIEQLLSEITTTNLRIHLQETYGPFLSTLRSNVVSRLAALVGSGPIVFNPQIYLDTLASEAMTSFVLFGNIDYRNKTYMFPDSLVKPLGIDRGKFLSDNGPGYKNVTIFGQQINYKNDALRLQDFLPAMSAKFKYTKNEINLLINLEKKMVQNAWFRTTFDDIFIDFLPVANKIIDLIILESLFGFGLQPETTDLKNFLKLSCSAKQSPESVRSEIWSSGDLMRSILNGSLNRFHFVTWVAAMTSFVLKKFGNEKVELVLAKILDDRIFQAGKFLAVYIERGKFAVIAPSKGRLRSFQRVSSSTRIEIVKEYKCFGNRLQKSRVSESDYYNIVYSSYQSNKSVSQILENIDRAEKNRRDAESREMIRNRNTR